MCGRYSLNPSPRDLKEYFGLTKIFSLEPRYNIAPSQDVVAIRLEEGERRLVMLHWGLIPFWADDPKIAFSTINARSETAYKAPSFRGAFRARRCLIPASGFYEWDKKGGTKQPYYIHRVDKELMAFAGLWEHWEDKEGEKIVESCTIMTTLASGPVKKIHERMPVVFGQRIFLSGSILVNKRLPDFVVC